MRKAFLLIVIGIIGLSANIRTYKESSISPQVREELRKLEQRKGSVPLDTIFFDDFETDTLWHSKDMWADSSRWHSRWHTDSLLAIDGKSWWCGESTANYIGYDNEWLMYLITPPIDLSSVTGPVHLYFKEKHKVEPPNGPFPSGYDAWDGVNVNISIDGVTYHVIDTAESLSPAYTSRSMYGFGYHWPYNDYDSACGVPGWGGGDGTVNTVSANLSGYIGDTIRIKFTFGSDPGFSAGDGGDSTLFGWVIDDIVLVDGNGDTIFFNNGGDSDTTTPYMVIKRRPAAGDYWHISQDTAYSGTYSWACYDTFGLRDALISPPIYIPPRGKAGTYVSYYIWCDLPDYDGDNDGYLDDLYNFYVGRDTVHFDRIGYDYAREGALSGWTYWNQLGPNFSPPIDISAYATDTVYLNWTETTDGNSDGGKGTGMHIDDICVTVQKDLSPPAFGSALVESIETGGPFPITSKILDISGVDASTVYLHFSFDNWATEDSVRMNLTDNDYYSGSIPVAPSGDTVRFYLSATDISPDKWHGTYPVNAPTQTFSFISGNPPSGNYLVWDPDPNHSSGPVIDSILSLKYSGDYTTDLSVYKGYLKNYGAILVCAGQYPNNFIMDTIWDDAKYLEDNLINASGNLYLEGGDIWYYDPEYYSAFDWAGYFNIIPAGDGYYDGVSEVTGAGGALTQGMYFTYNGESKWCDYILDISNATIAFKDGQNNPIGWYYDAGTYRTWGFSAELGGLDDGPQGTKSALLDTIMHYFAESVPPNFSPVAVFSIETGGPFPVRVRISDSSGVDTTSTYLYYTFTGDWSDKDSIHLTLLGNDFSGEIPAAGLGETVKFYVKAADVSVKHNIGYAPAGAPDNYYSFVSGNPPSGSYLIWDPSHTENTLDSLMKAWTTPSLVGSYTTDLSVYLNYLSNFHAVFVALGQSGGRHIISSDGYEGLYLKKYLDNGGNLYLEGGDFWYHDHDTAIGGIDLNDYFGVTGISDGGAISAVNGIAGTWTSGLSYTYSGHTGSSDYVDTSGCIPALRDQSGNLIGFYRNTELYRVWGFSGEFSGLEDGSGGTKADLLDKILRFFGLSGIAEKKMSKTHFGIAFINGNIFKNSLVMKVTIPQGKEANMSIYDITGRCVDHLFNGKGTGETSTLVWNRKDIGNGIYFVRLECGKQIITKKAIKIR